MTFTDIARTVANRVKVKSEEGLALIGEFVQTRYGEVATGIGIDATTVRTTATKAATVGVRSLVFGSSSVPVQKILAVYDATVTPVRVLDEVSYDTLRNSPVFPDPPSAYAIELMGARTVTIYLNSTPATTFTLTADVESTVSVLSGTMQPAFSEGFHDILIYGAYADALESQEKYAMADRQLKKFEKRLGELRYFLAKSAYQQVVQNRGVATRLYPLL